MENEAAQVIAEIGHGHAPAGAKLTDGTDREGHRPFLISEDMFNTGADGRAGRVAATNVLRHGLAARFLAMDM